MLCTLTPVLWSSKRQTQSTVKNKKNINFIILPQLFTFVEHNYEIKDDDCAGEKKLK